MNPVTTVIDNIYVKLSWDYPADNSDAVTEYEILIRKSDLTNFEIEPINCNGQNNAVVSKRYCHVPMSLLRGAPFNL